MGLKKARRSAAHCACPLLPLACARGYRKALLRSSAFYASARASAMLTLSSSATLQAWAGQPPGCWGS